MREPLAQNCEGHGCYGCPCTPCSVIRGTFVAVFGSEADAAERSVTKPWVEGQSGRRVRSSAP